MSAGQALGGTPRAQRQQRGQSQSSNGPSPNSCPAAPPGFELLFLSERSKLNNPFQAFILPLHWSLIRGGLRLRSTNAILSSASTSSIPTGELSELLPANWTSQITTKQEEGTNQLMNLLILRYWDQANTSIHYEAKVVEVVKNHAIVVLLFKALNGYGLDGNVEPANRVNMDSSSPSRNSAGLNFMLADYLVAPNTLQQNSSTGKNWFEVYKNLQPFEKLIWEQLMDPIGLQASGKPREPGPYESKSSSRAQQTAQSSPQSQQQPQPEPTPYQPIFTPQPQPVPAGGIGGPLYVPPALPMGGGGLGRSDLDPLGGFGGGMVADPRGFRQPPNMPFGGGGAGGMVPPPPGARFDPFGPPSQVPNPGRQPPPGPNPGTNWGVPNPDAEPPPGFDDMFM